MTQFVLTDGDDEFMITGCDGIWDVMLNEEAVGFVRRQLMQHNDPQWCATKLINQALRLRTSDNLTAIVVCFSSSHRVSQAAASKTWIQIKRTVHTSRYASRQRNGKSLCFLYY